MSLLNALRRSAKRSLQLIGPSAADHCRAFVESRRTADGGFRGRSDEADLYYTCFALLCLDGLDALPADTNKSVRSYPSYLAAQARRDDLDLVHTASLARCVALTGADLSPPLDWLQMIEAFRTPEGGFSEKPGAPAGSAYGAFLAIGALDDLGLFAGNQDENDKGVLFSLQCLRQKGGGFANTPDNPEPATNATAAAVIVLKRLGVAANAVASAADSLLKTYHDLGGFRANRFAPAPDLLSTATALHALAALGVRRGFDGEKTLQFIESLCQDDGGFAAHWLDSTTDVEYTFYGLLALGELVGLAEDVS